MHASQPGPALALRLVPAAPTPLSSPARPAPQVAERVRTDPRVRVMERTNLRALRLPDIGGRPVDLVTLDLSFISILKVLDAVGALLLAWWLGGMP